jgi:hypothetical protein
MQTDLKHLLKSFRLSGPQKRLFNAISREPTAHLYAKDYMFRNELTRGGIASALKRLKSLNLLLQEDGIWQVNPPEMRRWYQAVGHDPELAEELRFAELNDPYFWLNPGLKSVLPQCIAIFGGIINAMNWLESPNHSLGGQRPWDLLGTADGIMLVQDTLGRIAHGVFV